MHRKVDPEDVVQSAYKCFFHRHADGKLEVHDWGKLWSLLATITLRKCLDRVEYHRARCRDARREATARPDPEGTEPRIFPRTNKVGRPRGIEAGPCPDPIPLRRKVRTMIINDEVYGPD
jgi:hypothetical protein